MRVVYNVTRADLEALMLHHYAHGASTAGLRIAAQVALPVVVAGGFTALGIAYRAWPLPIIGILLALVLRVVLPRTMQWSIRAGLSRAIAQGAGRALGRHELEITDDGLVDHANDEEYLHAWEELVDVVALPERAYVYIGPREAYVLPRGGMREGDYQGFVRQLQKRVEANRATPPQ